MVVPDNIDIGGAVGIKPSCIASKFPVAGKSTFRLLAIPSVDTNSRDTYAPSNSGGITATSPLSLTVFGYLWLLGASYVMFFSR